MHVTMCAWVGAACVSSEGMGGGERPRDGGRGGESGDRASCRRREDLSAHGPFPRRTPCPLRLGRVRILPA